jgi:hypothetical protein
MGFIGGAGKLAAHQALRLSSPGLASAKKAARLDELL